tara:strand:+ start:259 stop:495 length:237 start_codon:yes stop_codon:yes gene_type:complete
MDENYRVFWTADVKHDTPYIGGLYYRSEIKDFVERVEADGDKEIVGIKIDDTYNLEFIYREIEVKTNVIDVDFGGEEE